jgi:hypothetical protein
VERRRGRRGGDVEGISCCQCCWHASDACFRAVLMLTSLPAVLHLAPLALARTAAAPHGRCHARPRTAHACGRTSRRSK